MKRKYLFEVIDMTCEECKGRGGWNEFVDIAPYNFNCNCDRWVTCKRCNGKGIIRTTSKSKDYEKFYIITLKRKIGNLNLKLSDVREIEANITKEMKKYCKELDKFVNKS